MDQSWRILIVCSRAECRQRLAATLGSWKLPMVAAATIQEAQRALKKHAIAQVFCEDTLPDGSYRDLLESLAARDSRKYLVVMLHDEQQYGEAIRLGAFDAIPFYYKPSDIRWLVFRAIHDAEESRHPGQRRSA